MAIIYSYPEKTSPAGGDFLVITDSEQPAPNKNRTKSLTIDNLASYVTTSTSGITGSGTLNTIAMFTPNGQAIGDSIMFQNSNNLEIQVGVFSGGSNTVLGPGFISTTGLGVRNISAQEGGEVTFSGNVIIGDGIGLPDYLTISSSVQDSNAAVGTEGQILVADPSSRLLWDNATDVVSGAVAKLIPYVTTATPGGSETYNALNNIVKIGWSGGNGIYVINLPSATAIPYRVIRFVTNGTYPGGGAHKVRFTATGGETIDGDAFFETSKVYEGIAVWSTGTEWVIIQAKAH
ncbi:MAG: hypothetical protein GY920_15650 [Aliivibrio sp.]|nr:hypothetical protein [Aliivibrio sp.]